MSVTFKKTHHFTASLVVVFFFGFMGGFLIQKVQSLAGPTAGPNDQGVGVASSAKGLLSGVIGSPADSSAVNSIFGKIAYLDGRISAITGGGGGSPIATAGNYFDVGGKQYYCTKFTLDANGYKSNVQNINNGYDCNGGPGFSPYNADGTLPVNAGPSWCVSGACQDKTLGRAGGDPGYCNKPTVTVGGIMDYVAVNQGLACSQSPVLYCSFGLCNSASPCSNIDSDIDTYIAKDTCPASGTDCDDTDSRAHPYADPEQAWRLGEFKDFDCSGNVDTRVDPVWVGYSTTTLTGCSYTNGGCSFQGSSCYDNCYSFCGNVNNRLPGADRMEYSSYELGTQLTSPDPLCPTSGTYDNVTCQCRNYDDQYYYR